jgi:group I intron endonuclease
MLVYLVTNKVNGKKYVGQTIQSLAKRWSGHLSTAKRGRGLHLYDAIRKYGKEAFEIAVLATVDNQVDLDEAERKYIATYQSNQPELGYNLADGGRGGPRGYFRPLTEGHKQRIKAARRGNSRLGKTQPLAARQKISQSNIGRPGTMLGRYHTEETKTLMASSAKGHQNALGIVRSEETKLRMSQGRKAAWAAKRRIENVERTALA